MAEKKNIQNILEILDLIDKGGDVIKDSLSDGKIDVWDLPKLLAIWPLVIDAASGVNEIVGEVKDLDKEELMKIGEQVTMLIIKYAALFGKKK